MSVKRAAAIALKAYALRWHIFFFLEEIAKLLLT